MKAPSWTIAATVVIVGAFICLVMFQLSTLVTDADKKLNDSHKQLTVALDKLDITLDNLSETTSKAPRIMEDVHHTFINFNRSCRGPAGADACGTLAQVNKTVIQVGDAAKFTQLQMQQSQRLLDDSTSQLAGVATHINKNMDTITFHSTAAVDKLKDLIQGGQPLLADAHTLLSNPDIPVLIRNGKNISGGMDHLVFTFDAVSTKATHNYLFPSKNPLKRTWDKTSPFVYPIVRIGAAAAPAF